MNAWGFREVGGAISKSGEIYNFKYVYKNLLIVYLWLVIHALFEGNILESVKRVNKIVKNNNLL